MYQRKLVPDEKARLVTKSGEVHEVEPLVTLTDDWGGVSHIIKDDHCYVLINGTREADFVRTSWWYHEAILALHSYLTERDPGIFGPLGGRVDMTGAPEIKDRALRECDGPLCQARGARTGKETVSQFLCILGYQIGSLCQVYTDSRGDFSEGYRGEATIALSDIITELRVLSEAFSLDADFSEDHYYKARVADQLLQMARGKGRLDHAWVYSLYTLGTLKAPERWVKEAKLGMTELLLAVGTICHELCIPYSECIVDGEERYMERIRERDAGKV